MTKSEAHLKSVFKVVTLAQWRQAVAHGVFEGSADDRRDGFIHMSALHQLQGTLAKHFAHQNNLLLIAFEAEALAPSLKWEISRCGEEFPHLYAPLETRLALWARPLTLDDQGIPQLPEAISGEKAA